MPPFDLATFVNMLLAAALGGLVSFGIACHWAKKQVRNLRTLGRFLEAVLESDAVSITTEGSRLVLKVDRVLSDGAIAGDNASAEAVRGEGESQ